jgi:hypothetical protein
VAPGSVDLWQEYLQWKETPRGRKQRRSGLVGSPETLRRKLRKFEASNIDQVILLNQAGSNTHQDICDSLELFAAQVMPEFHAREPEHQEWKRQVLRGEIDLPEIDTEPFSPGGVARPTITPDAAPSDTTTTLGTPTDGTRAESATAQN